MWRSAGGGRRSVSKRRMDLPSLVGKPHRGVGERSESPSPPLPPERRHEPRAALGLAGGRRAASASAASWPSSWRCARAPRPARLSPALPTGAARSPPPPPPPRTRRPGRRRRRRPGRRRRPRRERSAQRLDLGEDAARLVELRACLRASSRSPPASRTRLPLRVVVGGGCRRRRRRRCGRYPPPRCAGGGARRGPRPDGPRTPRPSARAAAPPPSAFAARRCCATQRRNLSLDAAERLRHHAAVALEVARLGPRRAQLLAHARTLLARGRKVRARGGELPLLLRLGVLDGQVLAPRLRSAASLNCV